MNKFALKELLDSEFSKIKLDKNFYRKIIKFTSDWENKNEETQEFVNSPLLGVHSIRFSTADEAMLFNDVLEVDEGILQDRIYKVEGINKNFKVSSNVVNISLAYLMHRMLLEDTDDFIMYCVYKIFFYKNISSIYHHFFKFNLPRERAVTLYEQLSDRFIIKKLGSWDKVAEYQADMMLVDKKAKSLRGNISNREKLKAFDTENVVLAINDMHGRIKDCICGLANALYSKNLKEVEAIRTTSSFDSIDGDSKLVSIDGTDYKINNYLYGIINNKNDFVKPKLVDLVVTYFKKVDKKKLIELLEYLTEVEVEANSDDDYIGKTMMASGRYLHKQGLRGRLEDIGVCLKRLLGYFRGAKVKDSDLIDAKTIITQHCYEGINITNKNSVASIVIGVMMYIFIRSVYRVSE